MVGGRKACSEGWSPELSSPLSSSPLSSSPLYSSVLRPGSWTLNEENLVYITPPSNCSTIFISFLEWRNHQGQLRCSRWSLSGFKEQGMSWQKLKILINLEITIICFNFQLSIIRDSALSMMILILPSTIQQRSIATLLGLWGFGNETEKSGKKLHQSWDKSVRKHLYSGIKDSDQT